MGSNTKWYKEEHLWPNYLGFRDDGFIYNGTRIVWYEIALIWYINMAELVLTYNPPNTRLVNFESVILEDNPYYIGEK